MDGVVRNRRLHSVLFAVVIVAGACGGSDADDQSADAADPVDTSANAEPPTSTTTSTTAEPSTTSTSEDATPVRGKLDWVVAVLNDGGQVSEFEVEKRFSPAFLAQVPAEQIAAVFPQLVAIAEPPYAIERFEAGVDGLSAEAVLLASDDRRLSAEIVVGAGAPNLIEGLLIAPTELTFPVPITVDAIGGRLEDLGSQSSLGVYDVTSGQCVAVHEIRNDSPIVLGSVFKLWVLVALASEIESGRAGWDETMSVTDELRSSPDGEIYDLEIGTEVTLRRLAEVMISISDNTATDMLLDRLGRQTVEASLDRAGVADPAANVPLLSTGNLFALKFAPNAPNSADYRGLDEAGRRSLLADLDESVLPWVRPGMSPEEMAESTNADGVSIGDPRDLDIEWFATAEDLCRTFVHLDELAARPGLEPVAEILEINPGVGLPFNRDRWPTIRFKGGSEPGVVAGAWWFDGPDGDRYVVAGGVANPDEAIDDVDAILTLASAIELID